MKNKQIDVFVNIKSNDVLVGYFFVDIIKGKEIYSFAFDDSYLEKNYKIILDPELSYVHGRQFKNDSSSIYGFISDAIPDRWGRNLLLRNEKIKSKFENRAPEKLGDSDFLLGINDFTRQGALRFKLHESNYFMGNGGKNSVPKLVYLNKLEQLSYNIDILSDDDIKDLLSPGSSLGGARPKATVFDNDGNLYIAKFSNKNDYYDIPKFEYFVNLLAKEVGLNVPDCKLIQGNKSIFLVKRFDRNEEERFPYISAMTLLGAHDGDSGQYSYLDLVDLIKIYSLKPAKDLKELFNRLIFNCIIHNGDDHLRNHGFLFLENGYSLSPLFDINPDPSATGLSLSIDGNDYSFDMDACINAAPYFGIAKKDAVIIADNIKNTIVSKFDSIRKKANISESEIKLISFIKE